MASTTDNVQAALPLFHQAFPGRVTTPEDGEKYTSHTKGTWSTACWQEAGAYIHLVTPEEVAQALAIVDKAQVKFAIRTTGHNPNVGFSSAGKDAVVLDLRQLQTKELTKDNIARAGAGLQWGEVYSWLQEHNRSVIGGRQADVGIAGFLVAGGLSAFPNLHGTGTDNIKNFQVALTSGQLVDANENENPDLYRALRGGGSNFGIVTRFDFITYPLIKVQWTLNMYNPEDRENILKATLEVQDAMEKDPKIGLFVNFNKGVVVVGLLYADHPEQPPAAFKPFHDLTSLIATIAPTANGTLFDLTKIMAEPEGHANRYISCLTTKNSLDVYKKAFDIREEANKLLPPDANLHYTLQPFGSAGAKAGNHRGGNSLGIEDIPQCWWVFTVEWKDDTHSANAKQSVDMLAKRLGKSAIDLKQDLDYLTMTFAGAKQQVLRSYGRENVARLQEVATKYDPTGVFQSLQNGGFLLRNNI